MIKRPFVVYNIIMFSPFTASMSAKFSASIALMASQSIVRIKYYP